jgi:hypothetical protein
LEEEHPVFLRKIYFHLSEEAMQTFKPYMILFLLMVIYGCSNVRVSQDYPLNTDYSPLKTYAWQSEKQEKTGDLRLDNPLLDVRIRSAIDTFLLEKGYQRVSDVQPDFFIAYHQKIFNRINSDQPRSGFVFGMGSFGYHGGLGFSTGNSAGSYDSNMLVIDIIDSTSGGTLWRGTGTRSVVQHADPEKITKVVNQTVKKILMQFPPQEK